ncbi:MAG: hypothetical protein HY744_08380 [Deltaproteobacteria bacterium]|nr:hypothetical protein [Deltaproteobacteria bacterium]
MLLAPLRAARPDRVRLLVIAKDVWSLRLNSDFRFKGGVLEYLFLQPSEENLLGTHRAVAAQFTLKRDTISAGGRLIDPRVADSRYRFVLDGNVIVNRKSGEAEGSFGFFQYGVPLYSLAQKWSHGAVVEWRREVTRRWDYERGRLATFDATATAQEDAIPYVYSTDDLYGRASVTRSFGLDVKHDVQVGVEASREAYRTDALGSFDPAAVAEFRAEVVPVSETRIDPYVQYHLHTSSFARLLDVDTLALQEDYRLGPELYLRFYPVAAALGSSRDLLGWHGEAAYTHELAGGLVRAVLAPTLELDLGAGRVTDSELHGQLHVASPRVLVGRFVYDGLVLLRPHNYLNRRVSLGGDGRLRGYPSQKFWGENAVASNLEFRTSPLQLWTVQLAGALFYDAGDAFDGPDELSPKQGAGLGLRLLFPQLERAVMRIDWGFALGPWSGRVLDGLVLTFRQGFGTPAPTGRGVVEGS